MTRTSTPYRRQTSAVSTRFLDAQLSRGLCAYCIYTSTLVKIKQKKRKDYKTNTQNVKTKKKVENILKEK